MTNPRAFSQPKFTLAIASFGHVTALAWHGAIKGKLWCEAAFEHEAEA
jgi:hypothetical protein